MKREITVGEVLGIMIVLLTSLVGWGVSVEVRLHSARIHNETTDKALTEMVMEVREMSSWIKEIHEEVVRHDERINAGLPQVVTMGDGILLMPKSAH